MQGPRKTLSPRRQALHYVGLALAVLGVLLFLSVFVTGAISFNNGSAFDPNPSEPLRALSGMILIMVGGVLAIVGRFGAAGAGIIPDPRRAREDVEPWSRAAGGMLNDALESVDILKPSQAPNATEIRVRCRHCQGLNREEAKFCDQCGRPL